MVDDDPALAEMLTIVLRGEGFDTAVVRDGAKALDVFRETHPDLVLLDLMLPGTSGLDVCKEIRAESGIPIIMLTAKTDTVDVVLGLESGADDYVMKPFKPKELTARIRARRYALLPQVASRDTSSSAMMPSGVRLRRQAACMAANWPLTHSR